MERVRDYGGFVVLFMGLGYLAGWALTAERLAAMPAGLHAIGLTAVAFLPLRAWSYMRERRTKTAAAAAAAPFAAIPMFRRPDPPRPHVKPRNHFGLRGTPR
jgi:hypothetical protein